MMMVKRLLDPLTDFLRDEIAGGVVLMLAAVLALIWANSGLSDSYFDLWESQLKLGIGSFAIELDLRHWVNDLLMAFFFFVVGLEIKRELVVGELRNRRAAALPAIAAVGGVILPALIFLAITAGSDAASGWAIPTATDIAFVVGVMALLGNRISSGVRLFLLAIAIIDDLIAILIIAIFYGGPLSASWLVLAGLAFAGILLMQRFGVARIAMYAPLALVAWLAVFESGIHATIAGVALGMLVPVHPFRGREIHRILEHRLHPVSAFIVVPIFALANAGVNFGDGMLGTALGSSITWAITGGLVVGKLLGIAGATLLALRMGWGVLPAGMARVQVWGVGALAGIGFTVSLFIADLAFESQILVNDAKAGIFLGSIIAGIFGSALMMRLGRADENPD